MHGRISRVRIFIWMPITLFEIFGVFNTSYTQISKYRKAAFLPNNYAITTPSFYVAYPQLLTVSLEKPWKRHKEARWLNCSVLSSDIVSEGRQYLDIPVPVTTILYGANVPRISVPAIFISAESSHYGFVWLKCSIFNLLSWEFFSAGVSWTVCTNVLWLYWIQNIVTVLLLLLLLLFIAIEISLDGSNPYTSNK